jgi:hypothetical protein
MGRLTAILVLIGGVAIIRSMMTPAVDMFYLSAGCLILIIALAMFITQVKKIR